MSAEKTYLVRRSDSPEREYRLHELTWLWRTAALPRDAVFQDSAGEWRAVRELVEPLLAKERERESRTAVPSKARDSHRWWWLAAAGVIVIVALSRGPEWQRQYAAWRLANAAERQAREQERRARTEDFVSRNDVVPGMLPDEVRRLIGPPRSVQATADASLERWFYRKQIVVFENGKVIGVEAPR